MPGALAGSYSIKPGIHGRPHGGDSPGTAPVIGAPLLSFDAGVWGSRQPTREALRTGHAGSGEIKEGRPSRVVTHSREGSSERHGILGIEILGRGWI
jgi:hypothetical protein